MNLIICVATMSQERMEDFLKGVAKDTFYNNRVIVIGTGEPLEHDPYGDAYYDLNPWIVQLDNIPRQYALVMKEKVKALTPFCNDETIVVLPDDDYDFNPYATSVIRKVFAENPEVDYLSLLHSPSIPDGDVYLSGLQFFRVGSCMGGSMIARWKVFKNHAESFFKKFGTDNMFDQLFWIYLRDELKIKDPVYTLTNPCSLVQHCNLGSEYRNSKMGGEWHHYAVNFDSRSNPFKLIGE
jgi:hypothetical protein